MASKDVTTLALDLADQGFYVFPLNGDYKPLRNSTGLNEATRDPNVIEDKFSRRSVEHIGVNTGRSGVIVLDIDRKNGKDGFQSIEDAWLDLPETFHYETKTGGGEHHVFLAPEGVFPPSVRYRGLEGVDRRSGGSYVVWYAGEAPKREQLTAAPEWLCDSVPQPTLHGFDGDVDEWVDRLVGGRPSLYVRNAMERLAGNKDLSHSDMVAAQFNAVRLGAEGHPGVQEYIDQIRSQWLGRNPELHSTPQAEWEYKFEEALSTAITKYGAQTELIQNLPEFDINVIPQHVNDVFIGSDEPADTYEWRRGLNALVQSGAPDSVIASTLWYAPRTRELSREWGIEFVYTRIDAAKETPEPTRENPTLPTAPEEIEASERESDHALLSDEERDLVANHWTFPDYYIETMKELGFVNEKLARASAWTVLSMALAFHGFIPKSGTQNMGLNLWFMCPAYSGTGKSSSVMAQMNVLRNVFADDGCEAGFQLGGDSSIQGLNLALLQRDKRASLLDIDEASGFFERLRSTEWMQGMDSTFSHWYEGYVSPSNKISLKDLRGKSALTSFNIHMLATPDKLFGVLDREMFKTGFLARFNWVIGDPPDDTDDRFIVSQYVGDGTDVSVERSTRKVLEITKDITDAANEFGDTPVPIFMNDAAQERMTQAYKAMFVAAEGHEDWDIIEPSITRLAQTMHKVAAMTAMYRGSDTITLCDALVAIREVETWYHNLFIVARHVSAGEFQRDVDQIESYVASNRTVTHTKLYHTFRNMVRRSRRDLDDRVEWLITSGRINKVNDKVLKYEINGSL